MLRHGSARTLERCGTEDAPATAVSEDELVLVLRLRPGGRLAGSLAEPGGSSQREFDGWIGFMGVLTDLQHELEARDAGNAGRHGTGDDSHS